MHHSDHQSDSLTHWQPESPSVIIVKQYFQQGKSSICATIEGPRCRHLLDLQAKIWNLKETGFRIEVLGRHVESVSFKSGLPQYENIRRSV